ncbi:MAG: 3-dehydroquinate synthase [Phycisphaerales bacterium]|nr:3-dehydroquinate synthase [Phycisphaerales bacterium]
MPQNERLDFDFSVRYRFRFRVAENALAPGNPALADAVRETMSQSPARCRFFVDDGLAQAKPSVIDDVGEYCAAHADCLAAVAEPVVIGGGECAKNQPRVLEDAIRAMRDARLCRQSYVVAIGGGALLDVVGFAAATTHRGLRLIRLPSTTLAQCDSGVAVKNAVNTFGSKNFCGTFAPPVAVINDPLLLRTLSERDWRGGFSEIAKIALIRDTELFEQLERDSAGIVARDLSIANPLIMRSAEAHLRHIVEGGDPFETGVGRPLDFGHWAAHRIEALSEFGVTHGEAVAMGIAIDVVYSHGIGALSAAHAERALELLAGLGFELYHPSMEDPDAVLAGLDEFREHLGGPLTITLLRGIGAGFDAHDIDRAAMSAAIQAVSARFGAKQRLCGSGK